MATHWAIPRWSRGSGQRRFRIAIDAGASGTMDTGDTVAAVFDELERLRSGDVTDEELRAARETAIVRLWSGFDDPAGAAAALARIDRHGYVRL